MFRVICETGQSYTGFSERMANAMFDAATRAGMLCLMRKKVDGAWVDVKENLPA